MVKVLDDWHDLHSANIAGMSMFTLFIMNTIYDYADEIIHIEIYTNKTFVFSICLCVPICYESCAKYRMIYYLICIV